MASEPRLQHSRWSAVMYDLIYLLIGFGFFALMALYARMAERL
jgi:hypothetical protein